METPKTRILHKITQHNQTLQTQRNKRKKRKKQYIRKEGQLQIYFISLQ